MTGAPPAGLRVALVGPCAVGKSTLAHALAEKGWNVRQPAQEHSGVADMWLRLSRPHVLIFLDARLDTVLARRPWLGLSRRDYDVLQERLAHAREHADMIHPVDDEDTAATLSAIEEFLAGWLAHRLRPEVSENL